MDAFQLNPDFVCEVEGNRLLVVDVQREVCYAFATTAKPLFDRLRTPFSLPSTDSPLAGFLHDLRAREIVVAAKGGLPIEWQGDVPTGPIVKETFRWMDEIQAQMSLAPAPLT
jgi:hypothetical protein